MTKPFMPAELAAVVSDLLAAVPGKG